MYEERPSAKALEVLKVLHEECERNPRLSLTGIPEQTLGKKAGAYLGMIYSEVYELENLGLVSQVGKYIRGSGRNVIITAKGREYVKSALHKPQKSDNGVGIWKWLTLKNIVIGVISAVIAGLIIAFITGQWKPW